MKMGIRISPFLTNSKDCDLEPWIQVSQSSILSVKVGNEPGYLSRKPEIACVVHRALTQVCGLFHTVKTKLVSNL